VLLYSEQRAYNSEKPEKNLEISGNLLILENSGKLSEFKIY